MHTVAGESGIIKYSMNPQSIVKPPVFGGYQFRKFGMEEMRFKRCTHPKARTVAYTDRNPSRLIVSSTQLIKADAVSEFSARETMKRIGNQEEEIRTHYWPSYKDDATTTQKQHQFKEG